jgi:hypothetical protein
MGEETIALGDIAALAPRRGLDHAESLTIAEVQATELLRLGGIVGPPVSVVDIARRCDVWVSHDPTADELGVAFPGPGGTWHIRFPSDHPADREVTVAHQLKRILDQADEVVLYPPINIMTTAVRKHYVAEHFATCLTLPHEWIERVWRAGQQDVTQLARLLCTTPTAMMQRLQVLRLVGPDIELSSPSSRG